MADEITSPLRPQLLGRMTQRAVVEALKAKGPMSRAEISRLTGISPTTVSSAVVQVLKSGYVEETDAEISGPGRPGKILRLGTPATQVLGVSIEPEWCDLVVSGLDGGVPPGRHVRFPTPNTYAILLAEIERHVRVWLDGEVRVLGLGLSLPGMIDPTGLQAVFSPNLHQTDNQQPARDLSERLGIPTVLFQECDALCLAERRANATDDLTIIDYTGGLGVGRLVGGRLLNRHLGLPTELGHLTVVPDGVLCGCGNSGCLETVATDATFVRLVSEKAKRPLTADEVFAAVRDNRIDARAEVNKVLEYLAIAVAAVTNLYAAPLVSLYGRLLDLAPHLLAELTAKSLARVLPPFRDRCVLVRATTTKAHGALAGILDHLFENLGPRLPSAPSAI